MSGFFALAFILVLIFLSWPEYQKNSALKQEVKTQEDKLLNHKQNLALLESYQTERINKVLPDDPQVPEVMVQIESLAQQSNLTLKSINFAKSNTEVTINTELFGSYYAFKDFLQAAESNLRLLDIMNLSFESPISPGAPYSFKLEIKAYYGSQQEAKDIID